MPIFCFQTKNHPEDDMAPTRTAAAVETHKHMISHRPQDSTSVTWGTEVLEKYSEYLKTDARTDAGRSQIAMINNVEVQWMELTSKYNEKTPIAKKCYELARLVAKEGSGFNVRFGHSEGFHRGGSSIQALTGSKIDTLTGVISAPSALAYTDFEIYGLMGPDERQDGRDFQDVVETALKGPCLFFDRTSYVGVKWIKTAICDEPIKTILDAFKKTSEQISNNKITSARKSATVLIGNLGRDALDSITTVELSHTPNTTSHIFAQTVITNKPGAKKKIAVARTKKAAAKDEEGVNVEAQAFGLYQYLVEEEFKAYCSDPFNEENEKRVVKQFSFPAMENKDVVLSVPYVNSHKSLLQNPPEITQLNTWTMNAIFFLPKVIHFLWSDQMNKPLDGAASSVECQQLALYGVCYHSNNFGVGNASGHGAMEHLYDLLDFKTFTTAYPNDIISAACFITDTINTALVHPREWLTIKGEKKASEDSLLKLVRDSGLLLDTIYSSIKSGLTVNDVIFNFGEYTQ